MKILTIGESVGFCGGLEQYCFQVARALASRGHGNVLLYSRTSDIDLERYRSAFEGSERIPESGGEADYSRFLAEICGRFSPDAVLVHKSRNLDFIRALLKALPSVAIIQDHFLYCLREVRYFPKDRNICTLPLGARCMLYGCFLGRPLRLKVIPTLHTLGPRRRLLAAHREFDGVVVLSNYMKSELVLNGFAPELIDVVHGFTVPPDEECPPPPDDAKFLFVGQVIRHKGLDVLLRAMALLPKDVRLTVAGEGGALAGNKYLAERLGIKDRVEFTGWINHETLEKHYAEALAQVVPSVWAEPFGLVGLEAMARSRPVVAFDVGGISDWLSDGETGLLAKDITPEALAAALRGLLDDRDAAREMGLAGRRRVLEKFVPRIAAEKIEACLNKAIAKRNENRSG